MGLTPVPGRLAVIFISVNASPSLMGEEATMLFLAIGLFFNSDGDGFFIPVPKAFSMFRMPDIMADNSGGSKDAR